MGFLNSAFGSAGVSAGASQGFGEVSTALSTFGQLNTAIGTSQLAAYQAQVAKNNAAIELTNANNAAAAGNVAESEEKLRTGLLVGQQKAAQAANGIDVNVGSPVAVRNSTEEVGSIDAAMIHYNAARQALGLEQEAQNQQTQSELDKKASANDLVGGVMKAGASFLSGASSLSSKWSQFQLSGAT